MALFHFSAKVFSRSLRNTVGAVAYRAGCQLADLRTGETFNYINKDVQHVELLLPKEAPQWAVDIQKLMIENRSKGVQAFVEIVESAERRINSQPWREFEFALHRELTKEQNIALAREFVQHQLCMRGMAAQLNFHFDVDKKTGEGKPHCHVIVPTRLLDETGMGKKERDWNKKEFLQDLRVQWQEYSNFHLKLHGHDVQIDHRCNKDRGIEMEPQPKIARGVRELEKRLQNLEGDENRTPITDKTKAFHDVQLRNLYRIMRRPEDVLEIVTKHHATFMWADVQKVLHRYVDDLPLFQRLESKLRNSNELISLKTDPDGQHIYSTRSMLKAEKSLVENAETLGQSKVHGVKGDTIQQAISKADEELKHFGGLSQDQRQAIYHLSDEGQLKCVVGIAGAGKTTALSVCQDIWQEEGYAVYGLAPTGKAAQNLEQGGISSTTLHKFLKEFENGRCQYNEKSVLVLDEAGMVDMERFEQLLGTVKQLGVKLIVVGDGAQLQPVEAGPTFRLVTTRLAKSELNTVLRQKEEWQKEATVLFGKQETQAAIQKYADKGHVHIVEDNLVSLGEALENDDKESIVKLYEISSRTSALIYREMMKACPRDLAGNQFVKQHQDFDRYLGWKDLQKSSAKQILKEGAAYHPFLEARSIDPTKMALLFVDNKLDKEAQGHAAAQLLKKAGLDSLAGIEKQPGQGIEVRAQAKEALIKAWHEEFQANPEKNSLMLAFSNRDTKDLNRSARILLKESGHISGEEFTYTIFKRIEDDFEREYIHKENKNFAKGDRIVFTRNTNNLGVKNGTMGTITELNKQTVKVKLDEGKEISFAPNLNPYFDQGWAITIHKSQGTTVDKTYVLASYEMTQNLAYVAMTRHRDDVQVFGSSLDFWRPEKLPEVLAKSGEKLSPGDYLDADSLSKLMQQDDRLLTKICERVANELEAMGAVSKKAFWQVADHFLGTHRDKVMRINQDVSREAIREEVRAEELSNSIEALKHQKRQSNEAEEYEVTGAKAGSTKGPFYGAGQVENALKQNMAAFADHIFQSIGEPHHQASSSTIERRYGKKGHIAVNLKTGAWIDHKDSSLSGGPLHMLTKLKGLEFKEAVEYGASWAGISADKKTLPRSSVTVHSYEIQSPDKEESTRIERAQALWEKGNNIQGTLAERYLREHRKIEGQLPSDLRYLPSFKDQSSDKSYPCLMSAARAPDGNTTAVQVTFLDPQTAAKADIDTPKRSFGVLKGSAVTIQEDKSSDVLFIAEGVETALSLKSAGIEETIKASLGLSNIKRLVPESPNTHVVICADHDAPDSPAAKSLEKSVLVLQEKGFNVTVVKPDKLNEDFNDLLKNEGPQKVREIISKALPHKIEPIQSDRTLVPEQSQNLISQAPNFASLVQHCEQRLLDFVKENNMALTPERAERIALQAERMATYVQHAQECTGRLPFEDEMANISMRAKFEVGRLPEIQQDLMDQGEENVFRAYRIADRLTSIEGRFYFEALQKGLDTPFNMSFMARRELDYHREELPHLAQDLMQRNFLSEAAAYHSAQNILRYRETHGQDPFSNQMEKMIQIAQRLEHKEYKSHDSAEVEFLRRKEGDFLYRYGLTYDASRDLDQAQLQIKKSLEIMQCQMEREREHIHQRELSL